MFTRLSFTWSEEIIELQNSELQTYRGHIGENITDKYP